jgi:hypothetical protein
MSLLFSRGQLRRYLEQKWKALFSQIDELPEDYILSRSVDDLTDQFLENAHIEPVILDAENPVDGSVDVVTVDVSDNHMWSGDTATGYRITAVYAFTGPSLLFHYRPQRYIAKHITAIVNEGEVSVTVERPGAIDPDAARKLMDERIKPIAKMVSYANHEISEHNHTARDKIANRIDGRRQQVMQRRELAGALGFPLTKRTNAPPTVPLRRKRLGVKPITEGIPRYEDEPALSDAHYEEAIDIVRSMLLAMERSSSTVFNMDEEHLRDHILLQLNGTFEGTATGETFVKTGKTDILIRINNRHIFVAECKWWDGPKSCDDAIDQLLSYMPWRDEKACLILFIDRVNATAIVEKADQTIRQHPDFKRLGQKSSDKSARRNFVLGHPGDHAREIHTAALFAVLS